MAEKVQKPKKISLFLKTHNVGHQSMRNNERNRMVPRKSGFDHWLAQKMLKTINDLTFFQQNNHFLHEYGFEEAAIFTVDAP